MGQNGNQRKRWHNHSGEKQQKRGMGKTNNKNQHHGPNNMDNNNKSARHAAPRGSNVNTNEQQRGCARGGREPTHQRRRAPRHVQKRCERNWTRGAPAFCGGARAAAWGKANKSAGNEARGITIVRRQCKTQAAVYAKNHQNAAPSLLQQ